MSFEGTNSLASLGTEGAKAVVARFVNHVSRQAHPDLPAPPKPEDAARIRPSASDEAARVGLTALNAFLQANVTGPVLENTAVSDAAFASALDRLPPVATSGQSKLDTFREACLRTLDTDGVSVYPFIPHVELFCLARWVFLDEVATQDSAAAIGSTTQTCAWMRFRIHLWHYKLLSQPSLTSGSLFTKAGRWTDVATLQELLEQSIVEAESSLPSPAQKLQNIDLLLEKANAFILLGEDMKAKQAVRDATELSGLTYALSGALGKRTRFQEKSISQLVVLAKSSDDTKDKYIPATGSAAVPDSLSLNDDTLLEKIAFTAEDDTPATASSLPPALQGVAPDNQPQLHPEDQIILLVEATLKDTFSPADSLTSEEILPFATRVIEDKSTNWQIYTQALLVRSRIELSRSRTLERGVLQMQAVVDQVVVDIDSSQHLTSTAQPDNGVALIPQIEVTGTDANLSVTRHSDNPSKPTTFFPAARNTESAPPEVRLRYINQLLSPPRWHLESELAYAWASVGSLMSALEIFKRLRLWAEVALCLAAASAGEDEDGRGSGGEQKAKAIIRWQLFQSTNGSSMESNDINSIPDTDSLRADDYQGRERAPAPPNAPRLWCILGDLESDPSHYERAWEISKRRFARAQKSLGELYTQRQQWVEAAAAYRLAVGVNRLSPELWNRLGDIELRLGNFPDAAEAFQRAISTANGEEGGEEARTWSNLGSALLSWYREIAKENKGSAPSTLRPPEEEDEDVESQDPSAQAPQSFEAKPATARAAELNKPAYKLLRDALSAFKRGAATASSNWRIWDNVVTLAASFSPQPAFDDIILGTRNVLRLRNSEDAIDTEILSLIVREVTSQSPIGSFDDPPFEPVRASLAAKTISLFDEAVIPLTTTNSQVWALLSRLLAWRRDYAGALDASEKAWRAGTGGVTGSALSATSASSARGNWLTDKEAWEVVVQRTTELVAAYENWGGHVESIGTKWKGKARNAVRSVLSKAKEAWEGSEGWVTLERLLEDLRA